MDLVILSETWLKPNSQFNFDIAGFKSLNFPRPYKHKKAKRGSGGLLLYINSTHINGISTVKSAIDRIWLKLNKCILNHNKDIYLCANYVPPQGSSSSNQYPLHWIDLQSEISSYSNLGDICLFGDLNARIGSLEDRNLNCSTPDRFPPRNHRDMTSNQYGQDLINLCQTSDLVILNGRIAGDSVGEFTCHSPNGSSTVDYGIVSYPCFSLVTSLQVKQLTPYSDHCAIVSSLLCKDTTKSLPSSQDYFHSRSYCHDLIKNHIEVPRILEEKVTNQSNCKYYVWNKEHASEFTDFLNSSNPPCLQPEDDICNAHSIDTLISDFTISVLKCAKDSGYVKEYSVNNQSNHCKSSGIKRKYPFKWYDAECAKYKKAARLKLSDWRLHTDNPLKRNEYFKARKTWKKIMRQKKNNARSSWNKFLKELSRTNPKQFWKIHRKPHKCSSDEIPLEIWRNHFVRLHSINPNDNVVEHSFNFENAEENIIFDVSDTITAISKLASAKAPGPDKIPAEVYKALPHNWLQFLTDLFNIIIKAEYYPSS